MTTVTYEQLQTEGLLTINFSLLSQNFKTIDRFIKDFSVFQRKFSDLEKSSKATHQDLTNFKISTQNTFSTLNDMVDTRSSNNRGASLADSQQIKQIKKSFKQVKNFITENTREQHQAQQTRDQQAEQIKNNLQSQITKLKQELQVSNHKITQLTDTLQNVRSQYTTKIETNNLDRKISQTTNQLEKVSNDYYQTKQMIQNINVKGFKDTIDEFKENITNDFDQIRRKFKLKADYSDVLKLEEMLINIINFSYENSFKKFSDKVQTKKALVFLEKRMNKIMSNLYGQQQGDREGLLVTKGFKCISCSKDLGELQGKLDKYKAWSVFPTKDPHIKDKYSGFGAGFQTIVQSSVNKKGGDISYDEKGRMTAPFNLSREVQGTLLKPSHSQSKFTKDSTGGKNQSPTKSPGKPMQLQTNFMMTYGRNIQPDFDLKDEYVQKQRGLMSYIKLIIQQKQSS